MSTQTGRTPNTSQIAVHATQSPSSPLRNPSTASPSTARIAKPHPLPPMRDEAQNGPTRTPVRIGQL